MSTPTSKRPTFTSSEREVTVTNLTTGEVEESQVTPRNRKPLGFVAGVLIGSVVTTGGVLLGAVIAVVGFAAGGV